ncbi:MAG: nickel pincer cofactor biosynthesis protein LarC [Anaerolineae bacterium]|nr:nickel pincer cofactor biosynthesis protein LarC [Anaerolineae bacterium]MDW8101049.1 nickel pincer cofactor biosynthesis protein LarC [Anaerolineae bacterium]
MRVAYFDVFFGASGDMILGALVDAGLSVNALQDVVRRLNLPEQVHIEVEPAIHHSLRGTRVTVHTAEARYHRHLSDIEAILQNADLETPVREQAQAVFRRLAEAEARVHGAPIETVHFHEVGALDAITDIVGVVAGLHLLGIEQIVCSPLPISRGIGRGEHGPLPWPAPGTMALLEGLPVRGLDVEGETLTPTGAALLTTLAKRFGPCPAMRLERVAYGAGRQSFPQAPNLLRLLIGEVDTVSTSAWAERLVVMETNLDNMNPEWFGPLCQGLFEAGALDVWLTPIQMKKGRPGTLLSVIARPEDIPRLRAQIFAETTTLGIREIEVTRWPLPRRIETVETPFGPVRVKLAEFAPGRWKAAPEHEDCVQAAQAASVPLREVYQAALMAAQPLMNLGRG